MGQARRHSHARRHGHGQGHGHGHDHGHGQDMEKLQTRNYHCINFQFMVSSYEGFA